MSAQAGAALLLALCAAPAAASAPEGLDALAADRSLIPTKEVERARALRARAGEAEAALRRIGGVQDVRVVLGDPGVSVVVRHAPGPAPVTVGAVRSIVRATLPDTPGEAVQVLLSAAPASTPAPPAPPTALLAVLGLLCLGLGGWAASRSVGRRGARATAKRDTQLEPWRGA